MENNKIEKGYLWQLVKEMEENVDQSKKELGEIVATLLVNFSDCNKGRHPVLIDKDDKPFAMLIKVLKYYAYNVKPERDQYIKTEPITPLSEYSSEALSDELERRCSGGVPADYDTVKDFEQRSKPFPVAKDQYGNDLYAISESSVSAGLYTKAELEGITNKTATAYRSSHEQELYDLSKKYGIKAVSEALKRGAPGSNAFNMHFIKIDFERAKDKRTCGKQKDQENRIA